MKILKALFLFTTLSFLACKPELIEPDAFRQASYYTNPDKNQIFEYYFDDGATVTNGLLQYIAKLETDAGTFVDEKLILLNYNKNVYDLPESLVPFTYFMGINFNGKIEKPIKVSFNLNYLYNNTNQSDYLFFKNNINKLELYEVKFENEDYYNSKATVNKYPFEIIGSDVIFYTDDNEALYGFCFEEVDWVDTVEVKIGSQSNLIVYKGNRADQINTDGTYLDATENVLISKYTEASLLNQTNPFNIDWNLSDIYISIKDPKVGVVSVSDTKAIIKIIDYNPTDGVVKTFLEVTDQTEIEIIEYNEKGNKGRIRFSGLMKVKATQVNRLVDILITFKKQRW